MNDNQTVLVGADPDDGYHECEGEPCATCAALAAPPVPSWAEGLRQVARAAADKLGLCGAWLSTDDDGTGWVCVLPPHEAGDHRGVTAATGDDRLREALAAIRDMEPEPVDVALPDHSDCAECKRIQSTPYHPSTCCEDLYRELMRRDRRWESARQDQLWRMRDIARAALSETPR